MGLIDRTVPKAVEVQNTANTDRKKEIFDLKKSKIGNNRKNIKVSPETLDLIKTVSTMQSKKNYQLVDEAIEFYIANTMTEREQRILKNLKNVK